MRARRLARPPGAPVDARPSRPSSSCGDSCGMAPRRVPSCPPLRHPLPGLGLRSSPHDTPPRPLGPSGNPPLRLRAAAPVRYRGVAWASDLAGRGCGRLHAREPGPPEGLRSGHAAMANRRRGRGPLPGAVPCWHGPVVKAGGRPPLDPRSGPGAHAAPRCRARGWACGGSGPGFLRPARPPRPGRRAGGAARRRAAPGGWHPGSAVGQTERAEPQNRPRVAHPRGVGGPAGDVRAPAGARPHRPLRRPHPPEHLGHPAPRPSQLPGGRAGHVDPAHTGQSRPRWHPSRPRGGWLACLVKPSRADGRN